MPAFLVRHRHRFQDDQLQTDFWAKFLAEGNVINNQLNNVAAGHNTTAGELQALVTEIQNYQQFGAAFDHTQGGIFGARFDNELLGGTLNADTANAVHGLQGILNGDTGAALAADQAQITAAGAGFVADAQDVSGNNIPIGGGTYVGDATTVAGATSVPGIAHGTIPVAGAADAGAGAGQGTGRAGGHRHWRHRHWHRHGRSECWRPGYHWSRHRPGNHGSRHRYTGRHPGSRWQQRRSRRRLSSL